MEILDIQQNTQEWEILRRNKIGASDAPVIMGVDPYRSPAELWEEKMIGSKIYSNKAMKRGHDLEPIVRSLVCKTHNSWYAPIVAQSDEHPFMIASLDGYDEVEQRIIEIKCPNDATFLHIENTLEVPIHWQYQMQHQMFVTGLSKCTLIVFNGSYFVEVVVNRDNTFIEAMIEKELAFYQSMMTHTQPEPDLPERTDQEMIDAINEYTKAKEASELAKEYEQICKDSIVYLSNDKPFRCQGKSVRKIIRQGNVDYSKIEFLKGIDLTPYRKASTEYWKID